MWLRAGETRGSEGTLRRMTDAIAHRGPDGEGGWWDHDAGVGLGHRRLAIIDVSEDGRQPMVSASGRYTIVFNGEIYNFRELRQRLGSGHTYRGHSDTEVMLAAIETWGVDKAILELSGMFACALWDRETRRLSLFRDRFGKKPLYYAMGEHHLHFASELKALAQVPGVCGELDRDALALYLEFNHVPTPACIYRGVRKLEAGSIVHVTRNEAGLLRHQASKYWSASERFAAAQAQRFQGSFDEAARELEVRLRKATLQRMVADVPLGAFLSGGLDSSTVVALMQAQSSARVRTFAIGFLDDHYNEAVHAAEVARPLGTEHTELYVDAQSARDVVPLLPSMFDEPFADSSQIPTYIVSRLAREHVTVALSGDGGDEIFCGYNRYLWWSKLQRLLRFMPRWSRRAFGRGVGVIAPAAIDRTSAVLGKVAPRLRKLNTPGDKLHKIAALLQADSADRLYLNMLTQWFGARNLVIGSDASPGRSPLLASARGFEQQIGAMMMHDVEHYMADDILVKVDRASMAVSLEARCPLLDHEVAEFAWSLPLEYKLQHGTTKRVLRDIAYRHVPRHLLERPKSGFAVPIDSWLRGPLRDWAESLLSPARLRADGLLNPEPVRRVWEEHLSGHRQWQYRIWGVLMFQAWLDEQRRCNAGRAHAA
jgi:asparagine synthase (glutamine-hydrolysing)